jgi:hypothetical protein
MSRKVYVDLEVRLVFHLDEDTKIEDAVDELIMKFYVDPMYGFVEDDAIIDWDVAGSK